mgnify:CR=1 FL=1
MAVSLRTYLNNQLKAKGMTATQAKKNAGKYKSISAAKKAGSLYYTDKNGKVMAAVFAEDLKKPISSAPKKSIKPKARPKKKAQGPTRLGVMTLDEKMEVDAANKSTKAARKKMGELPALPKGTDTKLPSQSAAFNAFFKKNKAKYKKDNGGFNTRQALKDFNARSK